MKFSTESTHEEDQRSNYENGQRSTDEKVLGARGAAICDGRGPCVCTLTKVRLLTSVNAAWWYSQGAAILFSYSLIDRPTAWCDCVFFSHRIRAVDES